ncbi:hypothetical protein [Ekhidna sp.]|uniref:hypothetical protein n=1 Tax=Ekhidna sp. TaxID=2608089 RepID=UPI003BAA1E2B
MFIVLFIPSGQTFRYQVLKGIRIDKERITYNASHRARDRVADYFVYTGTLFYDKRKLELSSKSDYSWFGPEMKRLAAELQIPIKKSY